MKIQIRAAAGLLIVGLAMAACSSSATTPTSAALVPVAPGQSSADGAASVPAQSTAAAPGGAAIDACALVTEKEATAFLGSDPGPGTNTGTSDAPACAYGASLTLVVAPTGGRAQYDADHGAAQGSGKATDLTGVGDAGYAFTVADTIAQMEIVKGTVVLTVNVQGDPSLQNITVAALTMLGAAIAGRL